MSQFTAIFDACVLYPAPLRDLLMHLALTPELALKQAKRNRIVLRRLVNSHRYSEVLISAGEEYMLALEPFDAWRREVTVTANKGRIGTQLKALKDWLRSRGLLTEETLEG